MEWLLRARRKSTASSLLVLAKSDEHEIRAELSRLYRQFTDQLMGTLASGAPDSSYRLAAQGYCGGLSYVLWCVERNGRHHRPYETVEAELRGLELLQSIVMMQVNGRKWTVLFQAQALVHLNRRLRAN